ncbi:MAG: response regulator transcription factor [Cyanobacteria bacterium P01_D01_bin.50]
MLMLSCEPSTLRVLVVDDHELTRLSLQLAFSSQENIQVVGMASNGKEALDMVKSCYPDVIVLDLQMPIMDGWSASCKIKDISPQTQIIAYSSVEEKYFQDTRATSKVDAFCRKDAPTNELVGLIKQLGEGGNEP